MKVIARVGVCGLSGSLVLVLLASLVVPYLGGPALFDRETVRLCRHLLQEVQRSEAITTRDERVQRCLEGRQEVIHELLARDLPVGEVIHRFRLLNGLMDDGQDGVLGSYCSHREGDDDVAICRHVVRWVRMTLREDPTRAEALVRRLEEELAQAQLVAKSAL